MDWNRFRMAPIDDRRAEPYQYNPMDEVRRLAASLNPTANPMMSAVDPNAMPPINALGQQAGMLDIDPSVRAIQMQLAKEQLAELLKARAKGKR